MHYGAMVGDHTTASMVVSLEKERIVVWTTGTSTPCVSLFKPWLFGAEHVLPVIAPEDPNGEAYWRAAEQFRRGLLGKKLPEEFYTQRDEIQQRWISKAQQLTEAEFPAFSKTCVEEELAFYEKWENAPLENARCAFGFAGRWAKKNRNF